MIVLVVYTRVRFMDAARRCMRCDGKGHERVKRSIPCPRCGATGIRPEGYAYSVDDAATAAELSLGDVVLCPPTPRSEGRPVHGTVVELDAARYAPLTRPIKPIIARVGVEWPEQPPGDLPGNDYAVIRSAGSICRWKDHYWTWTGGEWRYGGPAPRSEGARS